MGSLIVLGIDPGLTIGIATVRVENGRISSNAKMQIQWGNDFVNFLETIATTGSEFVVVMEDFALLESKAERVARNKRSRKMEAVQVIGAVKFWCAVNKIKLVLQEPSLNPMNAKHSGVAIPTNHSVSHKVIAYNHAHHYLLSNGIIKHRLLDED